jgi:mannosyl-3-phosphoglycerate phosphatase
MSYLIFSDLDGTLLDHHSYSFEAARLALDEIRERGYPLILASSKTRLEMIQIQYAVGFLGRPMIVENGSAIITPSEVTVLGKPYAEIRQFVEQVARKYRRKIRGFHNAGDDEITARTGLTGERLRRSRHREYSLPLFREERVFEILREETARAGLRLLIGARFLHVLGNTDKGKAVKTVIEQYQKKYPGQSFKTVALGDSPNDQEMFAAVETAIQVQKYDGSYDYRLQGANILKSGGIGPIGWNQSLLNLIRE